MNPDLNEVVKAQARDSAHMGMKSVHSALRDAFAMEAMKLYVSHQPGMVHAEVAAKCSYALADAMMKARSADDANG